MAREQRKDVDYFPHDCTHGRKMHVIEARYGNDGYAVWFKLLEQLGKANNHYIDISDEMTLMFLTSVFKVDEETTINILTDLAKIQAIDKELFDEHKILWSEKFCNSIEDAYRKRKQKMFSRDDILNAKLGKNDSIPRGNPPIPRGLTEKIPKSNQKVVNQAESIPKEEYSILKESREKENKVEKAHKILSDGDDEINIKTKLAFLEVEKNKEKNVTTKKENNISIAESLKYESTEWLDSVAMQQRHLPAIIIQKIDEFLIFLRTQEKEHTSRKEFVSHFINWISKKAQISQNKDPAKKENFIAGRQTEETLNSNFIKFKNYAK